MPACEPSCPLVKAQLKKIAAESPWILRKGNSVDVKTETVGLVHAKNEAVRTVHAKPKAVETVHDKTEAVGTVHDKTEAVRTVHAKPEAVGTVHDKTEAVRTIHAKNEAVETVHAKTEAVGTEVYNVGQSRRMDHATNAARMASRNQATMIATVKQEGHDKLLGTEPIQHATRFVGDSDGRLDRWDQETEQMREESVGGIGTDDTPAFQDECELSCPRRISRSSRRRKLEERQRIVDAYLLHKGAGYFEDFCTCSLSCLIRALKDDTFIRSILTSAAFFALGLKLCSELDAWYLPIRVS